MEDDVDSVFEMDFVTDFVTILNMFLGMGYDKAKEVALLEIKEDNNERH